MTIQSSISGEAKSTLRIIAIYRRAKANLSRQCLKQQIFLASIIGIPLLLLLINILINPDIENKKVPQDLTNDVHFGVIVDCGSTGSRAHIFKWFKNETIGPLPSIELVRDPTSGRALTKHIRPGLSSFNNEPDKASDYMEPIMEFISRSVPLDRHVDTPVYFMATAGLRLLDDPTQKMILSDITHDLKDKFNFPLIKSQVISGEYEGVYSWLSLNLEKIHTNDVVHDQSWGVIEVGGASVQVAFELNPEFEQQILRNLKDQDTIATFQNEQVTVDIFENNDIRLFVTTFLGLGVNSAREFAIDILVRDYTEEIDGLDSQRSIDELMKLQIDLKDPCLTRGSSETVQRPVEVIMQIDKPLGFVPKEPNQAFSARLEGTGDYLRCLNLLERVLQTIKSERLNCTPDRQVCPMVLLSENFIPYQHYHFAGLSEMFFTTKEINLAGQFNRSQVSRAAEEVCSMNYNDLAERNSQIRPKIHKSRALHECFRASWLLTVLHSSGFVMPDEYENFRTMSQIDGREIDWTIGAFVSEIARKNKSLE